MKAAIPRTAKDAQNPASSSRASLSSPHSGHLAQFAAMMNQSPQVQAQLKLRDEIQNSERVQRRMALAAEINHTQPSVAQPRLREEEEPAQREAAPTPNRTGLPDQLKSGVESLSGISLDDVKVHYNSAKPAQLNALAYAQGTDIHVAAGQEKHLPHEAWHIVQQKQGRVRPTMQMKGLRVNDDDGLERDADLMGEKARRLEGSGTSTHAAVNVGALRSHNFQAVCQREIVNAPDFLLTVIADGSADPEWDPQWTVALKRVAADQTFLDVIKTVDDEDESSILNLVRGVQELSKIGALSHYKPNPYKIAAEAVRWHAGIESGSGGSGFGALDVSEPPFSGRPAFPKFTQSKIPLKAGQHRRHILAWHTIRSFVELTYASHPDVVLGTINKKLQNPDAAAAEAFVEGHQHVVSGRAKAAGEQKVKGEKRKKGAEAPDLLAGLKLLQSDEELLESAEELLKIGLFVMNGNIRNLWAGKGKINSALNTAQMHINAALGKVSTFAGLSALAEAWHEVKAKDVYSVTTTVTRETIIQEGTIALSLWDQTKDPAREAEFVKGVVAKLREWVVSNLEVDVLAESKEKNEITFPKARDLGDAIGLIDNVVAGKVDVSTLEPQFIEMAISEFLTYRK